jgi:hypothetical protein
MLRISTKVPLEGFVDFKIGGQVICTVEHSDDLVVPTEIGTVLQGMLGRLTEIGIYFGMKMNVGKTKVMGI